MKKLSVLIFSIVFFLSLTGMRDPTEPPNYVSANDGVLSKSTTRLLGVFINRERRIAIIDREIVSEGSYLEDGSRVISIRQDSVDILHDALKETLYLPSSVRQHGV